MVAPCGARERKMLSPPRPSRKPNSGRSKSVTQSQRTLYYECFSGISGDMHLGAMIDLGVPLQHLRAELGKLELAGEFELVAEADTKMGIQGTKATVVLKPDAPRPHRHLSTIRDIIRRTELSPNVQDRAVGTFTALAEAEAAVHGIDIEQVHFHEVGATDAIVDILGAAIGLDWLGVTDIHAAPVEVGSGMVRCAHGLMPVPAPATARLLIGAPCTYGRVDGEATTPTGAAILKHAVSSFSWPRGFVAERIGYGLGQKDFAVPNVLRASLGTAASPDQARALEEESNILIECNIDDMSAEAFAPLMDALFSAGARDVFLTPIVMKKSRPGTKVSVLVDDACLDPVTERLFAASTTIGMRQHRVQKRMLPRQERVVATSLGDVRVKMAHLPDGRMRWKSEHDDIAALAEKTGNDYLTVKLRVDHDIDKAIG